ncbi:hypothetical protein MMC10_004254 [Thelotrema lepadinum]|nr:hypothetical protein [Thelotrema lepadinum]
MAPTTQEAPSFDEIIQAGRQRKKAEDLASEIFGKGKRTSSPSLGGRVKSGGVQSLASRITKSGQRANSSSPVTRPKFQATLNRDLGQIKNERGPRQSPFALGTTPSFNNNRNGGNAAMMKEFSIKGAAGPYVVVGSNFAPGTTSADIQSTMEIVAGEMVSCAIITSYPTVMAEMVFQDRTCADKVVTTFNNQKADGRLLHVYLKNGPPTQLPEPQPQPEPAAIFNPLPQPVPSVLVKSSSRELLPEKHSDYDARTTTERRAEPEFQDGRYGFESKEDNMEVDVDDRREQPASPPHQPRRNDSHQQSRNERTSERYTDDRRDRYGYRPGYSRDTHSNRRDYGGRDNNHNRYRNGNHRPAEPNRLYSDEMYSRSRGNGYR